MYKWQSPGKSSLLLLGKRAGKPAENFRSKLRVTVSVVTTTSTVGGNDDTGHDLRDYWGDHCRISKGDFHEDDEDTSFPNSVKRHVTELTVRRISLTFVCWLLSKCRSSHHCAVKNLSPAPFNLTFPTHSTPDARHMMTAGALC